MNHWQLLMWYVSPKSNHSPHMEENYRNHHTADNFILINVNIFYLGMKEFWWKSPRKNQKKRKNRNKGFIEQILQQYLLVLTSLTSSLSVYSRMSPLSHCQHQVSYQ
uniref:Uncharacterized protein n=1 Tax=Octopus bimaculoides TaxID=37653 RepID=A0A0L8GFB7_OCTBM